MLGRKQKALQKNRSADFNPDFVFTEREGMYDGSWAMADVMSQLKKKVRLIATGSPGPWAVRVGQCVKESNPGLTAFCHLLIFSRYCNSFGNTWYSFDGVGRNHQLPTVLIKTKQVPNVAK